MPSIQKTLAAALERVRRQATDEVVRGPDISRADRSQLMKRGFLVEIIKGWYALTTPQAEPGNTTFWHAHFWGFVRAYLEHRFGPEYVLSAEHSLDLWTGDNSTPAQLTVMAGRGGTSTVKLPNSSSLLIYTDKKNLPVVREQKMGVQVMPLAMALVRVSPTFFRLSATEAEIALRLVRPEDLSRTLLEESPSVAAAGRLIGAFRHGGLNDAADRLTADLTAAGFDFTETNPFVEPPRLPVALLFNSPHVGRLRVLWSEMLGVVSDRFLAPPAPVSAETCLNHVEDIYTHDAYHSLSIEGYQVTPELISRIAAGEWNPDMAGTDQAQVNAMAAKGYHECFKQVTQGLRKIFAGQDPVSTIEHDLQAWYRSLFSPAVQAGLVPAYALAGYRNRPVFIRGSEYVPPPHEAVAELLDTLFELLATDCPAGARAILGHFLFVYIHPYSDGNGRIGRFILNTLLAAGGYPWTVVRVERRRAYMTALEVASVQQDIRAFTDFVAEEMAASAHLAGAQPK